MSSIPPNSPWRGCAAYYPQPVGRDEEEHGAQYLQQTIYNFNCRILNPPLADIEYRSSSREADVRRHVYRWDHAHYKDVFRDGFENRRQEGTPDNVFYNLEHYINNGGRPLVNSQQPANYAFVSTTLNSGWHPSLQLPPNQAQLVVEAWRYEIYAPGGILIAETLGDRYQFPSQDEVCFVAGIAPQYIRSAQRFRLVIDRASRHTRRERVDDVLIVNAKFNPQSHPQRLINIQRPVSYYIAEGSRSTRVSLSISIYQPRDKTSAQKRGDLSNSVIDWYTDGVTKLEGYIDAAFRSSRRNQAYLFMKNEFLLLDYAPGTTNDKVLKGPMLIRDGFPSLKGTAFAEYGIDSSFGPSSASRDESSFIFSGKLCARINFAPGPTNDDFIITDGPMTIAKKFPFLKNTVFENGVDAAFESPTPYQAYLFRDDQYALINYNNNDATYGLIGNIRTISQGFGGLRNTIFKTGIDAAFASHRNNNNNNNEVYLFKGDSYALIKFTPSTNDCVIIGGVKKILPNWPSLQPILLPDTRQNRGIDLSGDDESTSTPPPKRRRP